MRAMPVAVSGGLKVMRHMVDTPMGRKRVQRATRWCTLAFIVTTLLGVAPPLPDPAHAHEPSVKPATASSSLTLRPSIDGGRMVYVSSEGSFGSIWVRDLASGASRRLSGSWSSHAPDIHASRVVWEELREKGSVIVLHDLETGKSEPISVGPHDHAPVVWGDRVVWTREYGTYGELIEYSIRSDTIAPRVTVDMGTTSDLREDTLIYASSGTMERFDLASGRRSRLPGALKGAEWPSIYGNMVAYATWKHGLSQVHVLDTVTGVSHPIVYGLSCAYAPALSHELIAWESYGPGARVEVRVSHLPTSFKQVSEDAFAPSARGTAAMIESIACVARMLGSMPAGMIARIFG